MKRIISALLMIALLPASSVYADTQYATLPSFDVCLNDTKTASTNREYPLIVYSGITYVPLTYYDCRYLGITSDWNSQTSTLTIQKGEAGCAYRSFYREKPNPSRFEVKKCDFNIVVNGKKIDNSKEEYPLILFREITYFPLTWRFAVEEFGWEYYFDSDSGLFIKSGNHNIQTVSLPFYTMNPATDGSYYYYNGINGDKNVVYRVPTDDFSAPEIIYEIPDTPMSRSASFIEDNGDVYLYCWIGSGPTMSTEKYYKIEADGSLTEQYPSDCYIYKHGALYFSMQNDGVTLEINNKNGTIDFIYTVNGAENKVSPLQPHYRIGRNKKASTNYAVLESNIQIYNGKIYYTAFDAENQTPSALYCIDTSDGNVEKLLDNVYGFWAFGKETLPDGLSYEKILYDSDGKLILYNTLTKESVIVEENDGYDIVLEKAIGEKTVYAVLQNGESDRTIVKKYDFSPDLISRETLMDTYTPAYWNIMSDKLYVSLLSEVSGEETRLLVADENKGVFRSADKIRGIFIYNDTLVYGTDNSGIAVVNFN